MSRKTGANQGDRPVAIAYYTGDYAAQAGRLRTSLVRHGFEHFLQRVPDQGSWLANTGLKPRFVQACLERFQDRALLYLDADAVLVRQPKLLETYREPGTCDIAIHFRPRQERKPELMSGTIYLANTPGCRRVVAEWVEEQTQHPDVWDQRNLQAVIERLGDAVRLKLLPASYCYIIGRTRSGEPPVIAHRLSSKARRKRRRTPVAKDPQ